MYVAEEKRPKFRGMAYYSSSSAASSGRQFNGGITTVGLSFWFGHILNLVKDQLLIEVKFRQKVCHNVNAQSNVTATYHPPKDVFWREVR